MQIVLDQPEHEVVEFIEISDEELLRLTDLLPKDDGFERTVQPVIWPLSIQEAYDHFFSDDAPYFLSEPF